jgi:hypothetical protein
MRSSRMARLRRDRHLDAALRLIQGSFRYQQEQGKLTQEEVAGTFLGLVGQLACSSQLTIKQQALCHEIYRMVASIPTTRQPGSQVAETIALAKVNRPDIV